MSTDPETRATLSVPDPSPETSMSLGKEWSGTDWNSAGLCVNTDGRIWLDANGDAGSSTLSALSNDVSGQLLLQSLSSNVFLIADDANAIVASGSVLVAGANSVRLFSAFGTTGIFSGATEQLLEDATSFENDSIGTDYFDRIAPAETTANSNTAGDYLDLCDDVSDAWTMAILAQSAWTVLMERRFARGGVTGAGGKASRVALAGQITALSTWLGLRRVAKILSEPGPAGLDMYSVGAISWATPGFLSTYSAMGTMLTSSVSVGGLGLVSASLNAGLNAVLKSPWRIGLDGKAAEAIAGTNLMLDAKSTLNLMGLNVNVGAVGGEALTQIPTVSIEALSVKDLNVKSLGKVKQFAGGTAKYGAPTIKLIAGTSIVLKSPNYEINISTAGISISMLKTTKIEMGSNGVIADCMGMALEVGSSGVTIGDSSASIQVDTVGSWLLNGPITTMT